MHVLEQHFYSDAEEKRSASLTFVVEWAVGVDRIPLANLVVSAIRLAGGTADDRSWRTPGSWSVVAEYVESGSNKRLVRISMHTEQEITEEEVVAAFQQATGTTPRELLENTHAKVTFQALWSDANAWLYASDDAIEVRLGVFGEQQKTCSTLAEAYEFSGVPARGWSYEKAEPSNDIALSIVRNVCGWGYDLEVEPSVKGWTARADGLVVDGSTFAMALGALEAARDERGQNPGFAR